MDVNSNDRQGWLIALQDELNSLVHSGTYNPTELLGQTKIDMGRVGSSKMVFSKKYHPDGTFDKYKVRLVFRGDRWIDQYDNKTYAGTPRSESVRLLLAIAAAKKMVLASADVKTAFLNSPIPPDQYIYMRRPVGLLDDQMPQIVRLRKCLYGLPMAPAAFRKHSDEALKGMGFTPTVSDPNVYIRQDIDRSYSYILVHVDDFLIVTPDEMERDIIFKQLHEVYDITMNKVVDQFLGLVIERDIEGCSIKISQPGYIEDMIETYKINCKYKPVTPMSDAERAPESESNPLLDAKQVEVYQSKVGTLMFLANQSCPVISFAVNMHSRYSKGPRKEDMKTLDRILQYVATQPKDGIILKSAEGVKLYATVDASYGTHADRKSHTAVTCHIGKTSGAFIWRSKKQTVTADSSTVAEFIATHTAAQEIMWTRSILAELGYPQEGPTLLQEDNQSTIAMLNNDCHGAKTKHIDIRYNLIREQVQRGVIKLVYCPTEDMISDILTKPLAPKPYLRLKPKILGELSTCLARCVRVLQCYVVQKSERASSFGAG
eukprot:CAMPEP_0182421592 /NCGR_PEP_ID=MMETSP1167-20130531/6995_1 /TAXON_ID=2988 /ORGANISM="Mallomonas Sp, Strain CCMP3275" /LENGTH=545 /DNA_ID=CAMNT_0024598843 /DNA_START=210 /DNA_END=1847 /DNA_ORIENTATION=+